MPSYMLNENGGNQRVDVEKICRIIINTVMLLILFGLYDFHDPLIMGNQDLIEGCKTRYQSQNGNTATG